MKHNDSSDSSNSDGSKSNLSKHQTVLYGLGLVLLVVFMIFNSFSKNVPEKSDRPPALGGNSGYLPQPQSQSFREGVQNNLKKSKGPEPQAAGKVPFIEQAQTAKYVTDSIVEKNYHIDTFGKNDVTDKLASLLNDAKSSLSKSMPAQNRKSASDRRAEALASLALKDVGEESQLSDNPSSERQAGQEIMAAGSVIECRPDMKTVSDYPGSVWRGIVSRPVYDINNNYILIPAGSVVMGRSNGVSNINQALQSRVLLVVDNIYKPDGEVIEFGVSAVDQSGIGAIPGDKNGHYFTRLAGISAYALLGLAPSLIASNGQPQSSKDTALSDVMNRNSQVWQEQGNLYSSIRPTITTDVGGMINIITTEHKYIEPWASTHF